MKEFVTDNYNSAKRDINNISNEFNNVLKTVGKSVMKVIEGKTLHDINLMDIPSLIKNDKVQTIPTFLEMLSVGVDLRQQVKLSEREEVDVQTVLEFIKGLTDQNYFNTKYFQLIQISKGIAVINVAGIQYLEDQKIFLNKYELELFSRLQSAIKYINQEINNKFVLYSIFDQTFINSFNHNDNTTLEKFKQVMKKHEVDKK